MKKIIFATFIFTAIAGFAAYGQQLNVDYLDGTVELKTARGWSAISIGDSLEPSASIRVSKGGSVELSRGNQRITVLKDGLYALADLLKAGEKNTKTGIAVALTQKLRTVTAVGSNSAVGVRGQATAGGVRGGDQGQPVENLTWMEGDETTQEDIRLLLDNRKFEEAIPLLTKALDESSNVEDEQLLKYELATAQYGSGQIARAYRTVSKATPAADVGYYPDFVILKAEIYLDSLQYKDGQAVLKTFLAQKPSVPYAQVAYLLSAQCAKGLGDEKAAAEALKAGLALDPQSDTAKEIQGMLAN